MTISRPDVLTANDLAILVARLTKRLRTLETRLGIEEFHQHPEFALADRVALLLQSRAFADHEHADLEDAQRALSEALTTKADSKHGHEQYARADRVAALFEQYAPLEHGHADLAADIADLARRLQTKAGIAHKHDDLLSGIEAVAERVAKQERHNHPDLMPSSRFAPRFRENFARAIRRHGLVSQEDAEVIARREARAGPMGRMPDHEWNSARTRVRFQRQDRDGRIVWGPWSSDLVGPAGLTPSGRIRASSASTVDLLGADRIEVTYDSQGRIDQVVKDDRITHYSYDGSDCDPKYVIEGPSGSALSESVWTVTRTTFDSQGRPTIRDRLDNVAGDDPDSLSWP